MQPSLQTRTHTRTLRLYNPHKAQLRFHHDRARFRVASWGRQTGKSTGCINELLKAAWRKPGGTFWYISPTFNQAMIMYRRMGGMLWPTRQILLKKNQTELRFKLDNQAQILFKSGEVFDNLRSETLDGVVIDEVRDQKPDLWTMVIRPMLARTGGWAAFVSTPNGFDHFYDLAMRAKNDSSGEWSFIQLPATDCPELWSAKEIESVRRDMTEPKFAQEILADFRDIHVGKAYTFSEKNLRRTSPFYDGLLFNPYIPIGLALDFNVNPMCWTVGQHRNDDFYWFDEVHLEDSNTPEASKVFVDKYLELRSLGHRANPNVIIVGDSAGNSRSTKSAGKTDYDILFAALTEAGITFENRTQDDNPAVKDRVNTMNTKLAPGSGEPHMWFHPDNCPYSVKDMQRVSWKPGAKGAILDKDKDKSLTHHSDGIGYYVFVISPIKGAEEVGRLHIIHARY